MSAASVSLFSEGVSLNLRNRRLVKAWILDLVRKEKGRAGAINFIFCTDAYLHEMNVQWLQHDTLTDVITFDLADPLSDSRNVEGDIYISLERVRENAREFGVGVQDECCRVMAHGVLHLLGYSDGTAAEKAIMRQKEDLYLSLLRKKLG